VAQLNRAAAEAERPTKENMGDSYDLVRGADVIMLIKGQEESDVVELWLDKNRQGPGGGLYLLEANLPQQTFREASGGAKVPDYRVVA
jgi:hypothetical protein